MRRVSSSSSVDQKEGAPVVSNSSSKSDSLCLCKRLFWSVGTSYFSAFCPLSAEETRQLPHSSAVVQLVSVTPAVPSGGDDKQRYLRQDMLAYTLSGDIVGIPYVAIVRKRQENGTPTQTVPIDTLTSSAWFPAVNTPFVGRTADDMGSRKDVFIIKNDEKTRQSLVNGETVVFSNTDGSASTGEESNTKSSSERRQEKALSPNLPRKETTQPTSVSPTSSSLYKLYNSVKKDTENANGLMHSFKESSPEAPKKCANEQPTMVLPRIDAVFSLAGLTPTNESISKRIAETLAKRSALSSQQIHAPKTSTPVDTDVATSDASLESGDNCSIVKSQVRGPHGTSPIGAAVTSELEGSRSGATRTLATHTKASDSGSVQPSPALPLQSTREFDTLVSAQNFPAVKPTPAVKTDDVVRAQSNLVEFCLSRIKPSSRGSKRGHGTNNKPRSSTKSPVLTVKQLLMSRRQLKSRSHLAHSTDVSEGTGALGSVPAVNGTVVADASGAQSSVAFQDETKQEAPRGAVGMALNRESSCDQMSPVEERETVKEPPLKIVIKTKRDSDNKVSITCQPVGDAPADFAGKVLCLRLHKLDVSPYSFVDPDLIVNGECESGERATLPGGQDTPSASSAVKSSSWDKQGQAPGVTFGPPATPLLETTSKAEGSVGVDAGSADGKREQKTKRRRKFRLAMATRCKRTQNQYKSAIPHHGERKRDTTPTEGREHLSDCQNTLPERAKQQGFEDPSCGAVGGFGDGFQGEVANHEPPKSHQVAGDFQNRMDGSGKEFATDVSRTTARSLDFHDDHWSDGARTSDSEWEYPDKASEEVGSDWDSSLEDEVTSSPFKRVQPIKATPFGDFQHMLPQDRLRLLEQSLKEHESILDAIKQPHGTK